MRQPLSLSLDPKGRCHSLTHAPHMLEGVGVCGGGGHARDSVPDPPIFISEFGPALCVAAPIRLALGIRSITFS